MELVESPCPAPAPTEVLLRVKAVGVNPVDWKTRQRGGLLGRPPFVLGWDVCGEVVALGAGATSLDVGDDALGLLRFPREAGTYAQYVTAPSRQLVRRPPALPVAEAAGLPLAGLTAWQALMDVAGLQEGQRVLVQAASGGVGHLAVQIAAARNAVVYGTARADKHDFLRALGVAHPVDYQEEAWREGLRDFDVVLDPFGGRAAIEALGCLAPGGVLISLSSATEPDLRAEADRRGVRAVVLDD